MPSKPSKPLTRDIKLFLWYLVYTVPVDAALDAQAIEDARRHCKLPPSKLEQLRFGPLWRHWDRMLAKRARRLAHYRQHGSVPDGWTPPLPGEPDRSKQVAAMKQWRAKVAPMRRKARKRPKAQVDE